MEHILLVVGLNILSVLVGAAAMHVLSNAHMEAYAEEIRRSALDYVETQEPEARRLAFAKLLEEVNKPGSPYGKHLRRSLSARYSQLLTREERN